MNHDSSIKYSRKWSKAGPPLSPTRRKPVDACQVHRTESENLAGTGNRKMKLIMRIRTKSMEETYGVALVPATASSGEKARPRVADESWVEE